MTTTGATVWDFLIAMRIPIWIIIILIILGFCISNADKLLALSGALAGLFSNISKLKAGGGNHRRFLLGRAW